MYAIQLIEKKQGNITDLFYNEEPVVSTQFQGFRFMSAGLLLFTKMEFQQTVLPIISQCLHQMREVVLFWIKLGSKVTLHFSWNRGRNKGVCFSIERIYLRIL